MDCKILCGHRGKAKQTEYYEAKLSKTPWPLSKHNSKPSLAVDVAPYPVDWTSPKAKHRFYMFAGYVLRTAQELGIDVRLGADWDGDWDLNDQTFDDTPHFELVLGSDNS